MEFRILGDFELLAGGHRVELGPAKQRILLAAMVVEAGRTVTADALIDLIWDDALPGDARNVLHTYVARVRRVLERARGQDDENVQLRHRPGGYELVVNAER